MRHIAIARQIFQNKLFFTSWGSFPCKKEKKSFYEKFAGRQQYLLQFLLTQFHS
jgi:hypothetical protein